MNHVSLTAGLMLGALAVAVPISTAETRVGLEQVWPFADDRSVRVDVKVEASAGQSLTGVELAGRITPWAGGDVLWEGSFGKFNVGAEPVTISCGTVSGLKPARWSPSSPSLYNLTVAARVEGQLLASHIARFGFRSFTTRDGRFYLNGDAVFLRGNAINPPGRGVPKEAGLTREFAEAYVRFMKSRNVNLIRLGADSDLWLDVCDELGMMVFQGRYGAPRGGSRTKPPTDFGEAIQRYKEQIFEPLVRHPSVVIYVLSNEMPYKDAPGEAYNAWLKRAHAALKQWDPTRLHIGNAGFGHGRTGDIYDMHPYWGWYGGDFTAYFRLRKDIRGGGDPVQPWTFSECVGCYTTPLGSFNVYRKLLAAGSTWAGHSADQNRAALGYQAFLVKQATEIVRRLRPINPKLAGIMPFTTMFRNWYGVSRFADMKPKPAMEQLGVSLQPVLLSWELWTPQVYAGSRLRTIAHVVNDSDDHAALTGAQLHYKIGGKDGHISAEGRVDLPDVPYYQARSIRVDVALPGDSRTDDYVLSGRIVQDGATVSRNEHRLFIASKQWLKPERLGAVTLLDRSGKTAEALRRLGIRFARAPDLAQASPKAGLVVGENAWDEGLGGPLSGFVRKGGRVLCLRQDGRTLDLSWLPVSVKLATTRGQPVRRVMYINPERPWHRAFDGIRRERLHWWSDYTGWDQTKDGFPKIHPVVLGFQFPDRCALAQTAVLATCDRGLTTTALCEIFDGRGSVILSGFDLVRRSGLDPVADRLFANLVAYVADPDGHHARPLITDPIVWGDYATERGVVVGPINGLLVNAHRYRNTRDRIPRGRRPFGPFGYNGLCHIVDKAPGSQTGSGVFWARVPLRRRVVVTKVENPAKEPAALEIHVNGDRTGDAEQIPSGVVLDVARPIPAGGGALSIGYTGDKRLILLETHFR